MRRMLARWSIAVLIGAVASVGSGCHSSTKPGNPPADGGTPTSTTGMDAGTPVTMTDGGTVSQGSCAAETYFEQQAWPQVFSKCAACHVPGGASGGTRFVLEPATAQNAVRDNYFIVANAAQSLTQGGQSLLLLKPTMQVPHGGGTVIATSDSSYSVLTEMLKELGDATKTAGCTGSQPEPTDQGVVLLDPHSTLRKAALQLVGRLPTDAEYAALDSGDQTTLSGLDEVLQSMMNEDAFYDRLKDMFNDILLTDAYRYEVGTYNFLAGQSIPASLRAYTACDPVNWMSYDERVMAEATRLCISASETLAREPVEMIAHVVREGRPFTEILTAQYRYINVDAAKVFGIDLSPFAGHETDPTYFAEVQIPQMHGPMGLMQEYAGILTTNAFLYRYNSTGTNRNRGRSYYFHKYFLGNDVMKSATRLDLSTVDFSKSPWRYNPQCTSCHTEIDPVAGAFQHWTNCYDDHTIQYFTTRYCGDSTKGWFPSTDMFPPGSAAGDENAFTPEQLPTALAFLAKAAVENPAFAETMASHVFVGLTNHERLDAPTDTTDPNYNALNAAYMAEKSLVQRLGQDFAAGNFDLKKLIIAVIKTTPFRAAYADMAGRVELTGLGGGTLTPPEVLHRKIAAAVGAPWGEANSQNPNTQHFLADPPYYYLSPKKFRLLAGGIDSINIRKRQRLPGSITSAIAERMALEMSCEYTAYDFALDASQRQLFPNVDRTLVPGGDATAADQKPILDNLRYLHQRILGETLAVDDPELLQTYNLLVNLQQAGAKAIAAGQTTSNLSPSCAAQAHYATGVKLPASQQFSADPKYVVRAWQGVIAYMLMDYRFVFEE